MPAHALLLAAGSGSRFGSHKLVAVWRGRPMIAHVITTINALRDRGAIAGALAVVRSGDDRVIDLARQAGFRLVLNSDPGEGLSHSLRLGLGALAMLDPVPDGALVFLADQPAVPIAAAEDVLTAWNLAGGPVVRPRYEASPAEPGHPILLDRDVWGLADGLTGDHGLGAALARAPDLVTYVDVDGANPDVDTPADLTRLPRSS
ncbi:MAG TPA: nucleotidyltransferase family protein [Gemmatimonadales bacterium]|nr:nucleotidyltransferase family protein [Gemmatimonadales bacterium]